MALPASGTISLNQVNVELGNSGTASINMGSSDVRGLFGVASGAISMSNGYGASSGDIYGSRGIVAGGYSSTSPAGWTTNVEYFNTAGTISSASFGTMLSTFVNGQPLATTNGSRALFSAGANTTVGTGYFTVATTGNATFFGNLTYNRTTGAACTNIVRGVFIAGSFTSYMDYHTISTTGNATTFGPFSTAATFYPEGTQSSSGRGIIAGGFPNPGDIKILYITIATTGNTSTFGNLTVATWNFAAGTNGSRAVWAGGQTASGSNAPHNLMSYSTIGTTGNANTFGYLATGNTSSVSGVSNGTKFFICGGDGPRNNIQVVTVATTGNSSSVATLSKTRQNSAATSGT